MSTQHTGEHERQQAWDLLGSVENHATVQGWLRDLDRVPHPTPRRLSRRGVLALAASVLIAIGAGILTYIYLAAQHYETQVGEQRDVLLPDGSRVTLNTNTSLRVRYSKTRRYMELQRGEALFSVNHDSSRPFDVSAGGTLTRALGTQFNVDLRRANVTVTVLQGAVRVSTSSAGSVAADLPSGGAPIVPALSKGEAVEVLPQEHRVVAGKADLRRIDAWRTRRLDFNDTPLREAVEEFNRYSTLHVVIGTRELESVRVSGVFGIGDTDGFLFSLREALGVKTLDSPKEVTLVRSN